MRTYARISLFGGPEHPEFGAAVFGFFALPHLISEQTQKRHKEAIMQRKYNLRPYAVKHPVPAGPVDAMLARELFQDDFDWSGRYFSDGTYVRKIVSRTEAKEDGLEFIFLGQRCTNGHIAPAVFSILDGVPHCTACLGQRANRRIKQEAA